MSESAPLQHATQSPTPGNTPQGIAQPPSDGQPGPGTVVVVQPQMYGQIVSQLSLSVKTKH